VCDHTPVHSGDRLLHHGRLGCPGLAGAERHKRTDEDQDERDGHRRPHRVDERVRKDRVRDLADLRREIRRRVGRKLEGGAALSSADLETLFSGRCEAVDERRASWLRQLCRVGRGLGTSAVASWF
jgi:hypothetical protein